MKILLAESSGFAPEAVALLETCGEVVAADLDRPALLEAVRDVDVLWVRLRNRIDAEVMDAAPRMKWLLTATTGLNHVDLDEARRRAIEVFSLRGESEFLKGIRATAELTLALALALVRRLPAAAAHARQGAWDRDRFRAHEFYGKTAGIVGYGRLGRIVGRYFVALGMDVLAADPHVGAADVESGVSLVDLDELLARADLISLHVNLCDETRGFFGRKQFQRIKPDAWLVNTARGELIDEAALLEALKSGRLAGAAVDVLSDEDPGGMGEHRLVRYAQQHENLILTPHVGGCTVESIAKTELFLARKLLAKLGVGRGGEA